MLSPNIPDVVKARQDLPLPEIRIGAFEPSLYGTITDGAVIYIHICLHIYIYIYIYIYKYILIYICSIYTDMK